MMRVRFISLITAAVFSTWVHAASDTADMSIIQQECVQVGNISFGAGQTWSDCHVTKGRWVATIGLVDMYQAQYCLGNGKEACDQRALVLFGNRAYTPQAKLLVQSIDLGSAVYDDPTIVMSDYGVVMVISAHLTNASLSNHYYLWQNHQWVLLDALEWLRELSKRLPSGVTARKGGLPDIDTMSSRVSLYRSEDEDCCPSAGVANVQLGLLKEKFFLKLVNLANNK
jgi:hypothetical protein